MNSSAEILFKNMGRLYQNIFNLTKAFQEASTTNQGNITVTLINEDDTTETVIVNSFQKILNELSRIDNNFMSTLNIDNLSYIINGDGSMSQVTKTSFANAEYLSSFIFPNNEANPENPNGSDCIIDLNSTIKNMVFPNVKIPVAIDSKLNSNVSCFMYEIIDGFENIDDSIDLLRLEYLLSQGTVTAISEKFTLSPEKEQVKYFGKFTVTSSTINGNNSTVILSDIKYGGLNVIGNSLNLKVDDILVNKSGTGKFQITAINNATKTLSLLRISGTGTITNGIDQLFFNELLPTNNNIVGIPVQPNKKLVVFLSTENLKVVGYPSIGIKIDTETLSVTNNDGTFTLDEYFNKYVTNISEYLMSLIRETTIPISLGVSPNKPLLNEANFKVLQINKHLTDAKATKELEKLNVSKEKLKNDITYKQNEINVIQNEVDTVKFKSTEEKNFRIIKIQSLRSDINVLNGNLLTVTRELNNNAIQYGLKNVKPKYRVIGMWDIQKPIYSPLTKPQNIVKYEVQYRYLSKNIDTVESTSYKMINDEGVELNVVISPWVDQSTRVLNKIKNIDGSTSWETPILDSVDDININQLSIAISEGESVEVRVRSISEAGFPIAPLKSDWSDILRVNFPNNLTESSLNSIVSKNEEDLKLSEFNDILNKSGMLNHISGQIQEAEKLFKHPASDITSGAFTAEQKNIPLDIYLRGLRNDLDILMNKNLEETLKIEVIDFNGEIYNVLNSSTLELSGGNYSDSFNLLDTTKFGSIIRKTGFIKIKNTNPNPLEVKTLSPGTIFDSVTASKYYNVPVKIQDALIQRNKQIIYFRNVDITGQNEDIFMLVKPKQPNTVTFPNPTYIDQIATENEKNLVYYDIDGNVKLAKLLQNAGNDFIALSKEHPMYDSENLDSLKPEFERIKLYTNSLKKLNFQEELTIDGEQLNQGLGFVDNDFFNVGENSCGAFLYPIISNPNAISVIGNTTISTLIIPANSEILIPFIYEYRMIDRFGKINGMNDLTINDEITYSKKIGIDLMINNEVFKFDINVTSKLKAKVVPIETLNVSSVVGLFGSEERESIQ